jgi:hypothetical protein
MDDNILQAHKRRLRLLEIRAAEMGRDTPPHMKATLARFETKPAAHKT